MCMYIYIYRPICIQADPGHMQELGLTVIKAVKRLFNQTVGRLARKNILSGSFRMPPVVTSKPEELPSKPEFDIQMWLCLTCMYVYMHIRFVHIYVYYIYTYTTYTSEYVYTQLYIYMHLPLCLCAV